MTPALNTDTLGSVTAEHADLHTLCKFLSYFEVAQSDTASIKLVRAEPGPEPELVPYDCSVASGALDFWHDEIEDIYTSNDGEPL